MKVVIVTRHTGSSYIPLALLYLKASLMQWARCRAEDVVTLEFGPDTSAAVIAAAILREEPDVVGLSCYVWNVGALLEAAAVVKTRRPGVHVVAGGPEVGPVADAVLARHAPLDAIVLSEGERPFAALVNTLRDGGALSTIPGIVCRGAGGEPVNTGAAPLVTDLDDYPSPHLLRLMDYTGRNVCIETQRGCVFHCNFCFYNKDFSLRNRRFSLDRVKDELRLALDRDVHEIYLMDPIFNLNAARAKEICRFIAEHNHRGHGCHAEIWAEFVDDESAALMKAANFRVLEVGLQSTDQEVLATTERRLRTARFEEGIRHLQRHGLNFELQLIYGLPGDTRAIYRQSLNAAMALDPPMLATFPLMVLPGTQLSRKAADFQLEFEPEPPYRARSHYSMTREDFEYGDRMIEGCRALQGSRTIRIMARERGVTFADLVEDWGTWRVRHGDGRELVDLLPRFVEDVCDARGIDSGFYREFGRFEFGRKEPDAPSLLPT